MLTTVINSRIKIKSNCSNHFNLPDFLLYLQEGFRTFSLCSVKTRIGAVSRILQGCYRFLAVKVLKPGVCTRKSGGYTSIGGRDESLIYINLHSKIEISLNVSNMYKYLLSNVKMQVWSLHY